MHISRRNLSSKMTHTLKPIALCCAAATKYNKQRAIPKIRQVHQSLRRAFLSRPVIPVVVVFFPQAVPPITNSNVGCLVGISMVDFHVPVSPRHFPRLRIRQCRIFALKDKTTKKTLNIEDPPLHHGTLCLFGWWNLLLLLFSSTGASV